MEVSTINAAVFAKMFLAGAKNLEAKKEWINELNVFPVPDGDTGTNMSMTIMSAAKAVSELENPTMKELAKAISSGSLRGARGNSGVILSQLFRGFTKVIAEYDELDVVILTEAMQKAVETAYKAVMKPKEGTILTVAKGAANKALELCDDTDDIVFFVDEVIKEAITRELERNGQVFYLFNNVEKIIRKADEISKLVPEARVEFAHGKMTGAEIESIMQDFIEHKTDVLVCTTILESGIDIPNANTIIVENADRFGLAQLHQLRGRVGRGQYQSYCVLKYNSKCSQVGKERMKTMQETNDGFVIAEKDLELRGTGEFFGTKQHGIPEFKIANLFVDMPMLKSVQSVALKIESEDKGLTQQKNERLRKIVDNKLKQSVSL